MKIVKTITYEKAQKDLQKEIERSKVRFEYLIEEIKDSNPLYLRASDFNYYAAELTNHCPDNKTYTPNDVRRMMLKDKDISLYDMIDTFIDDETDLIIDFY